MPFRFNPFTDKLDITEVGGGGSGISTLTGNSGGAVGPDGSSNINIVGSGAITVSGNALTNTLTINSSNPFFTWSIIVGNQMAITQKGYFTNGVGRVDVTLPNTSSIGDIFTVIDYGGEGFRIAQDTGQQILYGIDATTLGASGYLQSTFPRDGVTLICVVANTIWIAYPTQGNLTVN